MQQININELKPHQQNSFYFDDMSGDAWDELLRSISTSGVTNAITITQDNVIISGHQRVRACQVLGIPEISYKMIDYSQRDEKDQIKDLIESNLRQRVAVNPNPVKLGRCFNFLNEYYGLEHGGDRKSNANNLHLKEEADSPTTQTELAESYGITHQTMNNYMRLTKMIPELDDLVQTGIVAPTTALAMIKELSDEEQEDLIASLDVTKKISKKQVESYIAEHKNNSASINKADIDSYKNKIKELESELSSLKSKEETLERLQKLTEEEKETLQAIQDDIRELTQQKNNIGKQLRDVRDLAKLSAEMQQILETKLAPVKFMRCMDSIKSNDSVKKSLQQIIDHIDSWSKEMKVYINNENTVIVEYEEI